MPAVAITKQQKVQQRIENKAKRYKRKLDEAGIRYPAIAEAANLTRQAVSTQFKEFKLSPEVEAACEVLLDEVSGAENEKAEIIEQLKELIAKY